MSVRRNGVLVINSITIKGANNIGIKKEEAIIMDLESALLCGNCDRIHNIDIGCPVCGSKSFINLYEHFKGTVGKYNSFENNPGGKTKSEPKK